MLLDVRATPGLPRYSKAKGGGLRCYAQSRGTAAVQLVVLHQWGAHTSLVQRPGETLEACAIRRGRSVPYHLSVFANPIDPADPIVVWAWDDTTLSKMKACFTEIVITESDAILKEMTDTYQRQNGNQ